MAKLSPEQRRSMDKKLEELRRKDMIRKVACLLKDVGFEGVIVLGKEHFTWKETPLDEIEATQLIGIVDGYLKNERLRKAIQSQQEGNQP